MDNNGFIYKLLKTSLNKEYEIYEFYKNNSIKCHHFILKEILEELANQEFEHIKIIKELIKDEFSDSEEFDVEELILKQMSDYYQPSEIKIDNLFELTEYCINVENGALEFFEKIKEKYKGSGLINDKIDFLIAEEKEHKRIIAELVIKYKNKEMRYSNVKNIILFDLDGTLINPDANTDKNEIILRPNTEWLLKKLKNDYVLCVFSKSDYDYIEHTLKYFGLEKYFLYYFDYRYLSDERKNLVNLLRRLKLDSSFINKIIIIDDSYKIYPEHNLLKVHSFTGDKKDSLFKKNFIEMIENKFKKLQLSEIL